jgi:sec-independent protein translocase protein TatA
MGLDNPLHIAFLVVILLLVFGAKRLPEIGRSLGSGMREFKQSITGESATPQQPALGPAQQQQQQQALAAPAQPAAAPAPVPVQTPAASQPAPAAAPVPAQVAARPDDGEQNPAAEQRS